MPAKKNSVPAGFVRTDEMEKILAENVGSRIEAHAYDCTGEEVSSVGEAHTVVVWILKGEELIFETQVEGYPCMAAPRRKKTG
jgi:hypothetical protein